MPANAFCKASAAEGGSRFIIVEVAATATYVSGALALTDSKAQKKQKIVEASIRMFVRSPHLLQCVQIHYSGDKLLWLLIERATRAILVDKPENFLLRIYHAHTADIALLISMARDVSRRSRGCH